MTQWMNTLNTTSYRIIVSVALFAFMVMNVVVATMWFDWSPSAIQFDVLQWVFGAVILAMGIDVAALGVKRFSAKEYHEAKRGPSPVTVEAPSTVEVRPATAEQAADVLIAPAATPEAGREVQPKLAGE